MSKLRPVLKYFDCEYAGKVTKHTSRKIQSVLILFIFGFIIKVYKSKVLVSLMQYCFMNIVFATNNLHKVEEARSVLGKNFLLKTPRELNLFEDIPETADTLKGNALIKAQFIWQRLHIACFADDTGLEVNALNGAPGVYSARYAGEQHDSKANMAKLLKEMEGILDRRARFRTVIALIVDGKPFFFEGLLNGKIAEHPSGTGGFGYDPVFIPDGYDRTLAELSPEEKNLISHRGNSLRKLSAFLNQYKK